MLIQYAKDVAEIFFFPYFLGQPSICFYILNVFSSNIKRKDGRLAAVNNLRKDERHFESGGVGETCLSKNICRLLPPQLQDRNQHAMTLNLRHQLQVG